MIPFMNNWNFIKLILIKTFYGNNLVVICIHYIDTIKTTSRLIKNLMKRNSKIIEYFFIFSHKGTSPKQTLNARIDYIMEFKQYKIKINSESYKNFFDKSFAAT